MTDLYPGIEAELTTLRELHARNRRLRRMRDRLWDRMPWRLIPAWPSAVRRRVFVRYAERHYDG